MGQSTVSFRVESDLKSAADEVCARLDLTLSQVLRGALRDLVRRNPVFVTPDARLRELEALERKNLLNRVTRQELNFLRSSRRGE